VCVRALQRHRPDPRLLRQDDPLPPQPRGDHQANNAIHTIAIIRAKHQPETRAYLERRIREGKTRREALRSLKRHISRRLYDRLTAIP
jgi:hypothetical protein